MPTAPILDLKAAEDKAGAVNDLDDSRLHGSRSFDAYLGSKHCVVRWV